VWSEEALIHSRRIGAEMGAMFHGARVPIIVLYLDGRFAAANDAACKQYGYSLEELLTLRIHDLIVGDRDVDRDLRLVTEGEAELERRKHRRKDGSVLWVIPAACSMTLGGEPYIVSVLQNVTAIVEAENRAEKDERRAEDLWRAASEQLTDGIALIGHDYRVLKVNSAMRAMLRLTDDDILGKTCREVFGLCHETPCPHQIAAAERSRVVREFRGPRTGRFLKVEIIPCSPDNAHFAFIHIGHDQTEERAFRSELVRADRLATIGRLVAGVAHEVNNPAALVTVNLGVLRDRFAAGTARTADVLAMLDESIEGMGRIHDMVRDLKSFARERSREKVELGELASRAIRMAAHATRGHARVEKTLERDVWVTVRGARIVQVVLNLLINAVQAIPPGHQSEHQIGVRTFKDDGLACIEVSDTGPGVPVEHASRIFEPFFTTRENTGGTGLGLWLARQIVEEEGGNIVLCEGVGRGARFLVTLAAIPPEEIPSATRLADTREGSAPSSSRIRLMSGEAAPPSRRR
jgi:PAS domain S-box-containing protein